MINSVNAMEFLKPKLLTMDKYNSTKTTTLLPPSSLIQTRPFATVSGHRNVNTIDNFQEKQKRFLLNDDRKDQDRVKVQHLENHTKLQNNKCWNNFRTLYNISASSNVRDMEMFQMFQTKDDKEIMDVINAEHLTSTSITPNNIQNKSAFNVDLNNKYHNNSRIGGNNNYINNLSQFSSKIPETNNNYEVYCKQHNNYDPIKKQPLTTSVIMISTETQQTKTNISQRTEDQTNAYRHIESVHNYAKSKSFEGDDIDKISPNGSRRSSCIDDEDDEEDNDDDDDDIECDNDDDMNYEDRLHDDLELDYENIYSKRSYRKHQKFASSFDGSLSNKANDMMNSKGTELKTPPHFENNLEGHKIQSIESKKSYEEDVHIDVDVETVESQTSPSTSILDMKSLTANNGLADESTTSIKPDHHARRPMNAFLIFCKRHRAIVKERYKNLENRAITKILGDWWASLDVNDKKCFTNLAQQNKDVFFSANPNFKWYKLPAPPLRSLSTRPSNAFVQEYQEDNEVSTLNMASNIARYNNNHSNYFKLADEAQMGDLSQLMQDKSKGTRQCVDLQQVLGETSQFLSAHITGDSEVLEENHSKRRFYNENSFSSNSSEDDIIEPTKRSSRSCKGKRYQELINSGQIATALKKSKSSTRPAIGDGGDNTEINIKPNFINAKDFNNLSNSACQKPSSSESENIISHDLNGFDLEERIKELPALNLDDYLQRKRNTKKKKKISSYGKKRAQRSGASNNNSTNHTTSVNDKDIIIAKSSIETKVTASSNEHLQQPPAKQQQQTTTVVGSQKRKARKESITRRDVAAIEQEVASLLPLTINGCCYFQEAPTPIKYKKAIEKDTEENTVISQSLNITSISPIIPFKETSSSSVSVDVLNNINVSSNILNDNMSSTSDLLILAEVAANSTELKH